MKRKTIDHNDYRYVDKDKFVQLAREAYGEEWRRTLPIRLGYTDRQVRKWLNGHARIPGPVMGLVDAHVVMVRHGQSMGVNYNPYRFDVSEHDAYDKGFNAFSPERLQMPQPYQNMDLMGAFEVGWKTAEWAYGRANESSIQESVKAILSEAEK